METGQRETGRKKTERDREKGFMKKEASGDLLWPV
jgi:hypothetical protein